MSTAQPQTLLQHLIASNVLNESSGGALVISNTFRTGRDQSLCLSDRELTEIGEKVHSQSGDNQPEAIDPKLIRTVAAVDESVSGLAFPDIIAAANMIRKIEISGRIEGVPSSFLLLGIDELPAFLESNAATMLFCWREIVPLLRGSEMISDSSVLMASFPSGSVSVQYTDRRTQPSCETNTM